MRYSVLRITRSPRKKSRNVTSCLRLFLKALSVMEDLLEVQISSALARSLEILHRRMKSALICLSTVLDEIIDSTCQNPALMVRNYCGRADGRGKPMVSEGARDRACFVLVASVCSASSTTDTPYTAVPCDVASQQYC